MQSKDQNDPEVLAKIVLRSMEQKIAAHHANNWNGVDPVVVCVFVLNYDCARHWFEQIASEEDVPQIRFSPETQSMQMLVVAIAADNLDEFEALHVEQLCDLASQHDAIPVIVFGSDVVPLAYTTLLDSWFLDLPAATPRRLDWMQWN